jgi:hypothetical protein
MNTRSFVIRDQTHQPHTLTIREQALLLDGAAAAIFALEDNQVTLRSSTEKIAFSYSALGLAVLGDRSGPDDIGRLLAEYLGRWSAIQAVVTSLKSLQSCVGQIMTEAQPWLGITLPAQHFDDVTLRALAAFDGTEETTRMLAHILNQAPETVVAWARQLGKAVLDPPVLSPASVDALPPVAHHFHEEKSAQVVMEPGTRFRWTAELVRQLEEDFLYGDVEGTVARMQDIADRRGWPFASVRAKTYELKLPQRRNTPRETETSEQEGHSSEKQNAAAHEGSLE